MGVKTATKNEEFQISASSRDIFSDFNHTFLPHPNTGQISRKVNADAVKLAIRNLVLTNKYERLRNPSFGGNLTHYLFEPLDEDTALEIKNDIEWLIETYEPRAQVREIYCVVSADQNSVEVRIQFNVLTSKDVEDLDLTLYRVR